MEVLGNSRLSTESCRPHQVFQLLPHMDQPAMYLRQVCGTSINGMYLLARVTVDRSGAQRVSIGSWTGPTIAGKWVDV